MLVRRLVVATLVAPFALSVALRAFDAKKAVYVGATVNQGLEGGNRPVGAIINQSVQGGIYKRRTAPPAAVGTGSECDPSGKHCRAWTVAKVERFEHVGPGIYDPPCAVDPAEALKDLQTRIDKNKGMLDNVASGLTKIGNPLATMAGVVLYAIAQLSADTSTPLGQLFNPPDNHSRCVPILVVLGPNVKVTFVNFWVDDMLKHAWGTSDKGAPWTFDRWPLMEVTAGADTSFSKFALNQPPPRGQEAWTVAYTQLPLEDSAKHQPVALVVAPVFKNWVGGIDRKVGVVVSYDLP